MEYKKDIGVNPIWFAISGIFFVIGSVYSLISGKWFPGFPLQLDIFNIFGNNVGIYVEAVISLLIGIGLLFISIKLKKKV